MKANNREKSEMKKASTDEVDSMARGSIDFSNEEFARRTRGVAAITGGQLNGKRTEIVQEGDGNQWRQEVGLKPTEPQPTE
jgi:sulfur transfer protein SufE